MTDLKAQYQQPEGELIEQTMAGPPKVSARELARRIGMSDARVRQIINGYASQSGQILSVVGPADTVARMAEALGISAERMDAVGRSDVAEHMASLRSVGLLPDGKLWFTQDSEPELQAMRTWLNQPADARSDHPPLNVLRLWRWDQLLAAAKARVEDELEVLRFTVDAVSRHARPQKESEPVDTPGVALAADPGDDAAGESESYHET